ncbi:MAG: hypothetical protein K8U57_35885 [Planctomycetes bacterium]|nr:hypothetical protein [Planctomycetota bacterium]
MKMVTPGPWTITQCDKGGWRRYIKGPTENPLFVIAETDEEHARLIAAVPEIVAELSHYEDVMEAFYHGKYSQKQAWKMIRNLYQTRRALEKGEGEEA